jgi:hypothetical protein
MDQHSESSVRSGVPTYVVDALVAAVLLAIGVLVTVTSWKLGAGWTSDGPGSGYFPFGIGVIICISSVVTLVQSLIGKNKNTDIFVDGEQIVRVLQVFVPAIVYVAGIEFLGVYVASAIYIAAFMIWLGKFSIIKAVIAAVLVNVVFFFMFEVWFKVPLYKGTLDLLGFTGY